jgi:methylenetetrahydrofolate reductase (NADPH)
MTVSFEFFPPNNGNYARVGDNLDKLLKFDPKFISVTFGAGGSAENKSLELIKELSSRSTTKIVAHLTLVDKTKDRIARIVQQFRLLGIKTILAVRGDSPDKKYESTEDGFRETSDFVSYLKNQGFDVFVSAYAEPHPESPNIEYDLELLKEKVDAGATSAITQFCFDLEKLAELKNTLVRKNVAVELIPGVMPVQNINNLKRMADRCAINIPEDISTRFEVPEDEQRKVAFDLAVEQVATLKQVDFESFHFYTLNQSSLMEDLLAAI